MMSNSITKWHHITVVGSILAWFVFIFVYSGFTMPFAPQDNVYLVIFVLIQTFVFYLTMLLVPVLALLGDFLYMGVQRWFFPFDYQIVQELHKDDPEETSKDRLVSIGNEPTPQEARSYAIAELPRATSKHKGFALDSPGYESFFASQLGVHASQKPWDVARRASMKSRAAKK